jgi:hypothetical protein
MPALRRAADGAAGGFNAVQKLLTNRQQVLSQAGDRVADMGKRARQRRPQPGRKQPHSPAGQDRRQQVLSEPSPLEAANRKRMDGLARLAELTTAAQLLDAQITEQVDALAAAATSWPAIAQALGVSRQAAHQGHIRRHRARVPPSISPKSMSDTPHALSAR